MSPTRPVAPRGTGDLLADAGITVATPGGQAKDDTTRSKAPAATAWAWRPRCGLAAAKRVGLWRIAGHYVWALHHRARETGGSVLCLASRQRLCDVPPERCDHCRRPGVAPCPGVHVAAVLWRAPRRHEPTDAHRVATPLDGTCIDMHAPHTPESTP